MTIGRTNRSFLIKSGKKRYVLRINADNSHILGINRQREKTIIEMAGAFGIAPKVHYCSLHHGLLLTEYIDGQHWQPKDLEDSKNATLLTDSLAVLHSLPSTPSRFAYLQHAEHYWQQLQLVRSDIPDQLVQDRSRVLGIIDNIPPGSVICHHDPLPQNIIEKDGKLIFLDWEYAAPGWPAFDFAALSVEWNIAIEKLRLPPYVSHDEVLLATELYVYLCELWVCLQN